MSDNDLIRRGDALNACRASEHRYEAHDAIDALPAVQTFTAADLSDPTVIHANMLRGTIAKPTLEQVIHLYGVDALVKALAPALVQEAQVNETPKSEHVTRDMLSPEVQRMIREAEARGMDRLAMNPADAFVKADWFWRTMDPDDCGDSPEEAINRGMVGRFCVCEIASSYTGPTRYGFLAPVLDPESDDEEFVHFATQEEAIAEAKRRAEAAALRAGKETK